LQFFSQGQFTNPMVVRIAGLAYQKGFGGHFHNDNGIAAIREVPGLVLACPSNGRDAVGMLRTLLGAAAAEGTVGVFLEPIALYGVGEGVLAELVEGGFTGRLARVAAKDSFVPLGDAARLVFLAEAEIEDAARALLAR
jgi:2-oxoisovalerate dehydrogenase E1 component